MYRIKRALKEAAKFTFWMTAFIAGLVGFGVGTFLAVDALPLVVSAKIILTCVLWTIEIAFITAFFGSL